MSLESMFCSRSYFFISVIFLSVPLGFVGFDHFVCKQADATTSDQGSSERDSVTRVFFGPKKVLFCFPSEYVTGVDQLFDGSWRAEIVMFLPDLSSEAVYDKLHPIPPSPIFWSPERIAYSHSILQIEVTSSYLGPSDPTGELSLRQGLEDPEQFDFPSSKYPVDGFKEYDDKWGYPDLYIYQGAEPYFITCFASFCGLEEILNRSFLVDISLDKSAISRALFILKKFNQITSSTKCSK